METYIQKKDAGLRFLRKFFGVLVWPYDQSMDAGSSWFRLLFHPGGSSYQQLLDRNESTSRNDPNFFYREPKDHHESDWFAKVLAELNADI